MIKNYLLVIFSSLFVFSAWAQPQARVQFANNCPDVNMNALDVYIDGNLVLDDIPFRFATPYMDVPATLPFTLSIAPENSTSVANAFYNATIILQVNDTMVAIANGMQNTAGYNPPKSFRVDTLIGAREAAKSMANMDILFMNGSTDAPPMDFRMGVNTIVDDLAFGSFHSYLEMLFGSYTFRITNTTGSKSFDTYKLPLSVLGLPGQSTVLITSGFRNPASNHNGAAFEPMLIPSYGGMFIPLSATDPEAYARLQLIHNTADKSIDTVDVYIDGNKTTDNLPFRTATAFFDAAVDVSTSIGLAPKNSTSAGDIFYTKNIKFDSAKIYVMAINGIQSSSGYSPNPPLSMDASGNALEEALSATNTDMLMMHGSTDLPVIDVKDGTTTLVNDLAYGSFSSSISLPGSQNYVFSVTDPANNELVKYKVQLFSSGLGGKATTLLFSGFKDPAANSNGAPYGLYYSSALGGPLVPFAVSTDITDPVGDHGISIWPNPAQGILHINATAGIQEAAVYDMTGKKLIAIGERETSVDISRLAKSMYMLKATSDGKTSYSKFIKE